MNAPSTGSTPSSPTQEAAGHIVVGVDGSEPSMHALRWARFLAAATASPIEVVVAWELYPAYGMMGAGMVTMPSEWDPQGDADGMVTAAVDDVYGPDRPVGLEIAACRGNAAQVLIEKSSQARMVVVGSRGHGGFSGLLLGSVSAACAEHSQCPVFVVHGSAPPPGE
jgi:nucleotide-binding universal stress UspA family protein